MTQEQKQNFTRRITQANKSQLVVILYEILLLHLEQAQKEYAQMHIKEYQEEIKKARESLTHLRESLDFQYAISSNLCSIYLFADRQLSKNYYHKIDENLAAIEKMMTKLHNAFEEASKQDQTAPLMENTQTVYAGLTYGRNSLNESVSNFGKRRGFLA